MKYVYEVTVIAGHQFDKVVYREFFASGEAAFRAERDALAQAQFNDPEWRRSYDAHVQRHEVK